MESGLKTLKESKDVTNTVMKSRGEMKERRHESMVGLSPAPKPGDKGESQEQRWAAAVTIVTTAVVPQVGHRGTCLVPEIIIISCVGKDDHQSILSHLRLVSKQGVFYCLDFVEAACVYLQLTVDCISCTNTVLCRLEQGGYEVVSPESLSTDFTLEEVTREAGPPTDEEADDVMTEELLEASKGAAIFTEIQELAEAGPTAQLNQVLALKFSSSG